MLPPTLRALGDGSTQGGNSTQSVVDRTLGSIVFAVSPRSNLRRLVHQANDARDRGQWAEAADLYEKALQRSPRRIDLWLQAGHARKESGNLAGAEVAYCRAESLNPMNVEVQIQLGHLFKLVGNAERAARHYRTAVDRGSTDEHAIYFLQLVGSGETPGDALANFDLEKADLARDAGLFDRAAILYRQALETYPRAPIFVQLGNCLKEIGSLLAAEEAYLAALNLDPADADCLLQLGHLMKVMGNFGRAKTYFEASIRLQPDRPDASRELALLQTSETATTTGIVAERPRGPQIRPITRSTDAIIHRLRLSQSRRRV